MIGFASYLFDLDGDFTFSDMHLDLSVQTSRDMSRRVARTKILDGEVYIADSGVTVGDRTFSVTILQPTEELMTKFREVFTAHSKFVFSNSDGTFLTYFESMRLVQGNAVLTFLVKETL